MDEKKMLIDTAHCLERIIKFKSAWYSVAICKCIHTLHIYATCILYTYTSEIVTAVERFPCLQIFAFLSFFLLSYIHHCYSHFFHSSFLYYVCVCVCVLLYRRCLIWCHFLLVFFFCIYSQPHSCLFFFQFILCYPAP